MVDPLDKKQNNVEVLVPLADLLKLFPYSKFLPEMINLFNYLERNKIGFLTIKEYPRYTQNSRDCM